MTVRETLKKPIFILKGVGTYLPGPLAQLLPKHETQFEGRGARTGERQYLSMSDYALSCYTSWMRTLVSLREHHIVGPFERVGEIGPGDTLGVGLCALLSGSKQYFALDIVPTITSSEYSNLEMLEELIVLFQKREPLPDETMFPKNMPTLASYVFPSDILSEEVLAETLNPERLDDIRRLVKKFTAGEHAEENGLLIKYLVPWTREDVLAANTGRLDLLVSFAAMEHVDNVEEIYQAQQRLLSTGGIIAHAIDYKCHHTAGLWNGHWTYSELMWKVVRGRCVYLINRWPHSWHWREIKKHFDFCYEIVRTGENFLSRADLAKRFTDITDTDLVTRVAFLVARKR